jgi:hypothetical protein
VDRVRWNLKFLCARYTDKGSISLLVDVLQKPAFEGMPQFEIRAVGRPSPGVLPSAETPGAAAAAAASDAEELDSDGESKSRT